MSNLSTEHRGTPMIPSSCTRCLLVLAVTLAACSTSNTLPNDGEVQLGIVNALTASGAQLKVDQGNVALPLSGQASSITVTAGAHRLQLSSSSGQSLVDTNFSVIAGRRQTVVFTGSAAGSAAVSIATDTISTNGNGYRSVVGSVLMVNSAPGVGPFDVVVYQANSDSVYRFGDFAYGAGSLPPPAPYGFYVPFVPATYTFTITNPGAIPALATTTLTLATDDRWTVMLAISIEGGLVLQAVKQP
jgi:hypothetical protein